MITEETLHTPYHRRGHAAGLAAKRAGVSTFNQTAATKYAKAIESNGHHWCSVENHAMAGAVLIVKARQRPFPVVARITSHEEARKWAPEPADAAVVAAVTRGQREGLASLTALKQARARGLTVANGTWRALWARTVTEKRFVPEGYEVVSVLAKRYGINPETLRSAGIRGRAPMIRSAAGYAMKAEDVERWIKEAVHVCGRKRVERTHCIRGHELTHEVRYVRKDGTVACRVCRRVRRRAG